MAPGKLFRIAFWGATIFAATALTFGVYYYLHARPAVFPSEMEERISAFLHNPNMPMDHLKGMALDLHNLLVGARHLLDATVDVALFLSLAAAIVLGMIAYRVHQKRGAEDAL
jgi:hypothetical protein